MLTLINLHLLGYAFENKIIQKLHYKLKYLLSKIRLTLEIEF